MLLAQQNRLPSRAVLIMAVSFCLLSLAQVVRPVHWIDPNSLAISAVAQHSGCHATPEVRPRKARPQTPDLARSLLAVPVLCHCRPALAALRAASFWPMQTWPAHRRLAPAFPDILEPA
jgi:hypothetical protein